MNSAIERLRDILATTVHPGRSFLPIKVIVNRGLDDVSYAVTPLAHLRAIKFTCTAASSLCTEVVCAAMEQHQLATGGTGRFLAFVGLDLCARLNAAAPPRSSSDYSPFATAVVEECRRLCSWLVHQDRLPRTSILELLCAQDGIPTSSVRARAEELLQCFLNENWVELCKTISGEASQEDADEWIGDAWIFATTALKSLFTNARHRETVLALLSGQEEFSSLKSRLGDVVRLVPVPSRLRTRPRAAGNCHRGLAFLVHRVTSAEIAVDGATMYCAGGSSSTVWDDEQRLGPTLVVLIRQWSGEELPWVPPSKGTKILLVFQDALSEAQLLCLEQLAVARDWALHVQSLWWCCNVGPELLWKLSLELSILPINLGAATLPVSPDGGVVHDYQPRNQSIADCLEMVKRKRAAVTTLRTTGDGDGLNGVGRLAIVKWSPLNTLEFRFNSPRTEGVLVLEKAMNNDASSASVGREIDTPGSVHFSVVMMYPTESILTLMKYSFWSSFERLCAAFYGCASLSSSTAATLCAGAGWTDLLWVAQLRRDHPLEATNQEKAFIKVITRAALADSIERYITLLMINSGRHFHEAMEALQKSFEGIESFIQATKKSACNPSLLGYGELLPIPPLQNLFEIRNGGTDVLTSDVASWDPVLERQSALLGVAGLVQALLLPSVVVFQSGVGVQIV